MGALQKGQNLMTQLYNEFVRNPTLIVLIGFVCAPIIAGALLLILSLCKVAHDTDEQMEREQEERRQR